MAQRSADRIPHICHTGGARIAQAPQWTAGDFFCGSVERFGLSGHVAGDGGCWSSGGFAWLTPRNLGNARVTAPSRGVGTVACCHGGGGPATHGVSPPGRLWIRESCGIDESLWLLSLLLRRRRNESLTGQRCQYTVQLPVRR